MESKQENTKRIAKNTLMLYVRMLFSMLVSLYTSRVVLSTLGVEDYGIYNVVGGFVAMFSLVSNSLSTSVSRFLTFELGRGDTDKLKRVFSTSLLIHLALVALVLVLAETIGVWFLNTQMNIPAERLHAANWVFQASILSFMLGLFSVPYNASIVSHERMSAFAYIGILDVVMRLCIVLFIANSPWQFDRLIVYAMLLVAVSMSLQCIYLFYCRRNFEECRLHFHFDKECWKDMSAFAGWNFIGCTAGLLKDNGVNILLNLFIGPVVNAARGIATSVNVAVVGFANNFMTALNPQITKSYASGDRAYMMSLVERGSRFSYYILLMLALPLLFETEFVLALWLKHYPEHTVNFVRLVLLLTMCEMPSYTLINLQLATGNIRNYQIVVGGMVLLNFPLSYLCLWMGLPPEMTYVVAIAISLACMLLRLFFLRQLAGLSVGRFLKQVCLNISYVTAAVVVAPCFMHFQMEYGWIRFVAVSVAGLVCTAMGIYMLGCSAEERNGIRRYCNGCIGRISIKSKNR